jgi:tight adherence protein B
MITSELGLWVIPLLFALAFAGLGYTLIRAVSEGAERYAAEHAEETARQLEDIFLFIPAKRINDLSRILAVALFAITFMVFGDLTSTGGLLAGGVFGLIAGFAGLKAPQWVLGVLKRRRIQRFNQQLVDALMTMSNSLRAGFSIMQSFEGIVKERQVPIAEEFGVFLHKTRVGVAFEEALGQMEERVGSEDLTLMIRAIETARMTGGNLTEVFEKIAATIRERVRIEGRIRALTAQGRMQATVVGALPVLLLFAMTQLDPGMMIAFMTSKAGISLLVLAAVLELSGILVIRKIVRIEV